MVTGENECAEVCRLRRLLSVHDRPGPAVALVSGRAGTGKSRLVRRLTGLPEARARSLRVLAFTTGRPELRAPDAAGGAGHGAGADEDPLAAVEAWHDPSGPPALLVVEDVHRADAGAGARLRAVLARPAGRLVAVLTYRPEELAGPGLPLGAPVPYPAESTVLRIRLTPLDADEVGRRATAALGEHRCSQGFVDRLYARSGGVPQVVVDLLRTLDDGGPDLCTAAEVDAAGVPVRLAELVLGRAAGLAPEHRKVVGAAAVLDAPASLADLAAVAGLTTDGGRAALLAAEAAGVLREHDGGRYGFEVPLAATAVHEALPGPVREDLHRRAARVLGRRQPVPWAQLARHHRRYGAVRAWLRAVERAAEAAAAAGRHQDAIELAEDALADVRVPQPARVRLALLLARSAVVGLRSEQTVEVLRRIIGDLALPAEVRGEIRLDLALLLNNQAGSSSDGRSELIGAAEELRGRPELAARAMSALAMPYWPGGTFAENLAWLERAEAAASESGDAVVQVAVAANRATVLINTGDADSWQLVEQLPRESEQLACRQHVARGLNNTADAAVWLGEYHRATALLTEGRALAARTGASYAQRTGGSTVLLLEWTTGMWAGLSGRAAAFAREAGEGSPTAADAELVLAQLALAKGDWSRAASLVSDTGAFSPDAAVPLAAAASGVRIRLATARREPEEAAAEAARAWARVRHKGVWAWAAELAPWAVEATAAAGRPDAAHAWIAEFAAGIEGLRVPSGVASLARCRAVLAEAEGEAATAARHFRAAAEAYAALPRPYDAALAREGAGRCALPLGGAEARRAVDELTAATKELDDLGAVWDAARVRATLRTGPQGTERRPPGRPGYGGRLSPREQEVAALAGTGLTNREIADTLHLSSRTVEQHVARALRKLGAHSRQDLATEGPGAEGAGAGGG
ncbi:LuxR C-terminal-related transcriptional regulator [Streptomyces sp. NPDC093589]|uniref:helix-turn-helix transcriptional regulator n=1 Tax=Streptomyces sp. NPDC093589 TaxID=3366043 RepID=UPI0038284EAF